jgi:carbon storage regulator
MLVLTRYPNQRIMIGDDIVITVLTIAPGKVRIGVDAPQNMPIHREEIKIKIDEERNRDKEDKS